MKRTISKEINDFFTGKDLRVDHFLIRCARATELFSHVDNDLIGLNVYEVEKLLDKDLSDYYRARIKEYNFQLNNINSETKKQKKAIFNQRLEELKQQVGRFDIRHMWKYRQARADVKEFKKLGVEGYHDLRKTEIRDKMVSLGDELIRTSEFTANRNKDVVEFIDSLPNAVITHEYKDDWKKIESPKGYEKYFKMDRRKYPTNEQFLLAALNKIKSLSLSKREDFEKVSLECAEVRANEEHYKNAMFRERLNALRNAVFAWPAMNKYPQITAVALNAINGLVPSSSEEMLELGRLKTHKAMNLVYTRVIKDIKKEMDTNIQEM